MIVCGALFPDPCAIVKSEKFRPSSPKTSVPLVKSLIISALSILSPPPPARSTIVSEPDPEVIVSLPVPPSSVSSAPPPMSISSPAPP